MILLGCFQEEEKNLLDKGKNSIGLHFNLFKKYFSEREDEEGANGVLFVNLVTEKAMIRSVNDFKKCVGEKYEKQLPVIWKYFCFVAGECRNETCICKDIVNENHTYIDNAIENSMVYELFNIKGSHHVHIKKNHNNLRCDGWYCDSESESDEDEILLLMDCFTT